MGFKAYKLCKSTINKEQKLYKNGKLVFYAQNLRTASKGELECEYLLKKGLFDLDLEYLEISGVKCSVIKGEVIMCFKEKLSVDFIKALSMREERLIVCEDAAFGSTANKASVRDACKKCGLEVEVI